MAVKTIKWALIVLSIFFVAVISFSFGSYNSKSSSTISYVNIALYDLDIEMDLLEYWKRNHNSDSYLEEKIKHLILNKLLILSRTKPPIVDLKDVPLEALYRLITYNEKFKLTLSKYDNAFQTATNYLKTIENDVKKRMKERNEIFSKPLKSMEN